MNKKLTLFKQQAGIDYNPDQEGLNLFAKLIIEMCANEARNHTLRSSGIPKDYNGITNVEMEIRKLYESDN
jgi:hypothetical protein